MSKIKKRASSSSAPADDGGLIHHARVGAEAAIKDFQKRFPADLAKQVEKIVDQGQKTMLIGLKAIQAQLKTSAKQADMDRLTKRVDALAMQVERLAAAHPARASAAEALAKPAATRAGGGKASPPRATKAAKGG